MNLSGPIFVAICLASPNGMLGSGSYTPRPPQPPASAIEDSGKYELGKAIFLGNAVLTPQIKADNAGQRGRLLDLQERLPARVRKTVDLPSLAGKLSPIQLVALAYFLKVRYKIV
jgi:hypothetical protein